VHPRNLQLASIQNGYVIEKPHSFLDGKFFCGFVRLPAGHINSLGSMKKSDRGEVEIADIINFAAERHAYNLRALGITWGDLTYEHDCESIMALVNERQ
jgi:dTDP-glucose pyrophosphorylase